jgi:tetratricopeptide (TPR) repeat protein
MGFRTLFILFCFFSPGLSRVNFNPRYIYDSTDSLLMRGISLVYEEKFDDALAAFDSVIRIDPESPRGYFFVAACYNNLMSDYKNVSCEPPFRKHVEQAIKIGEARKKSGKATAEDLFYYGGAIGYRGIFRSFNGDWVGAFTDGLKGRGLLNDSFRADSTNKDIYLGLGTYDYWRSAKTKLLWWTPFFGDKRQQGIDETKIAAADGKFSSVEADYSLIRIYYDYGKYDSLINHWENSCKKFNPQDPYALYWVGLGYIKKKDYPKALACFQTVLDSYFNSPYYDSAGEMECRYYMGFCQYFIGDHEAAQKNLAIASNFAKHLRDRKDAKEAIDNLDNFLEKIQEDSK